MNEKYYLNSDIEEICKNIKSYSKLISGKVFLISGANGFLGKYFIKTIISMNSQLNKKAKIIAIDIKTLINFTCLIFGVMHRTIFLHTFYFFI